MTLFDTDIMPGLHTSLFIVTLELHKVFQATTEVEALIIKKIPSKFALKIKMANNGGEGFLLTSKLYKNKNMPLFCPLRSRSRKSRQPLIQKGRRSSNKRK